MSALTLLPAATRQARPWKNGGGTTTEIAVFPAGAGMKDFDWRLSMASVTERGPFSHFAGVDRILAVIEGRLELAFDTGVVVLDPESSPHVFSGEARVIGTPLEGAVLDLNLMTRRGRWTATMERVALPHARMFASIETMLVFTAEGSLHRGDETVKVQPFDAIRVQDALGQSIGLEGDGSVWVISLSR